MPNTEQLLYQTEKKHWRFSIKTLFLNILQYPWENTCMKFLRTPILKKIYIWLLLSWLHEVTLWNFCFWIALKHSRLSNITKYQPLSNQSFKQNSAYMSPIYLLLYVLVNLGFVCSSLTITAHKKQMLFVLGILVKRFSNIVWCVIWLDRKSCRWNFAMAILEPIH